MLKRIWIVGVPGSGKSTLADRLAERLGVTATHMDDIHWRPGWQENPRADTRARMLAIIENNEGWVIDGNYLALLQEQAARVDLFVWLDLPLAVTFARLIRRGIVRSITREPCCNGNYESLRKTFLSRDSLLLWALTNHRRRRAALHACILDKPHVRFESVAELERWLEALQPDGLRV